MLLSCECYCKQQKGIVSIYITCLLVQGGNFGTNNIQQIVGNNGFDLFTKK